MRIGFDRKTGYIGAVLLAVCLGVVALVGASNLPTQESSETNTALAFQSADGSTLTLSDFRGKTILLNIWATWCPPCRDEMPSLDRLQALRGNDSFEVVALSIDKAGRDNVLPFFDDIGIERLAIYLDPPGSVMRTLNLVGLPTTLLFNDRGQEIMRWVGPKEWDAPDVIAEIDALVAGRGGTVP